MTVPAMKNLLVTSHAFIFLLTFDHLNASRGHYYKLGRDRGQPASPRAGYGLLFCGRDWNQPQLWRTADAGARCFPEPQRQEAAQFTLPSYCRA